MNIKLATGQNITLKNVPEDMDEGLVLRKLQEQAPDIFQSHMSALKSSNPDAYKRQINSLGSTGADSSALAKDTGPVDAAMIAAGGATDSLLSGVKGLFSDDNTNVLTGGTADDRRSIMSPLEEERPVATALGSALPYMAVPVGAASGAVGKGVGLLGKTVGSQALQRGGQAVGKSLLADAAVGGAALGGADQDNTALGGAAGGVLGFGVGKAAQKGMQALAPLGDDAVRAWSWAKDKGFSLSPGRRSGSGLLRGVETRLETTPWTRGPADAIKTDNHKLANEIINESFGESGDSISMATLDKAHSRLGNEFEKYASKANKVKVDNTLMRAIKNIENNRNVPGMDLDENFFKALNVIRDQFYTTGEMDGKFFQRLTRRIGGTARGLARSQTGDKDAAIAMMEVVEALDDAMERSLGREFRSGFRKAKDQYKNLMTIETGQVVKTGGDVSLPNLANVLRKKDPKGFRTGKNETDLYELAHFGDVPQFNAMVGTSGTGERSFSLTSPIATGATVGGIVGQGFGNPAAGAVAGAGLGMLSPFAARGASAAYYGSRHIPDVLGSGILSRPGAAIGGLDERQRGLLGIPTIRITKDASDYQ